MTNDYYRSRKQFIENTVAGALTVVAVVLWAFVFGEIIYFCY